nr:class I SAM-dependent methyltransferase [Mesobacterium pallidum]
MHIGNDRQGPGSDAMTRRALSLAGLSPDPSLRVADIGCGTGAASLVLARDLGCPVTAVDFLPQFLARLADRARAAGLADRITPLAASMEALPFAPESLDLIWSEGAIYNMGFTSGITEWRGFLRPGGVLAVSELTWLTQDRPAALEAHWTAQYAEVAPASAKIAALEAAGYRLLGYFPLPRDAWMAQYYDPLQRGMADFLARHDSEAARQIAKAEAAEIALYEANAAHVGYGFYVAQRL